MKSIKINKDELLGIVRSNLDKHRSAHLESVAAYKELVLKIAQANLKLAKTGNIQEFSKIKMVPPAPKSYEESYERAIRMLELSVDGTIELDENEFSQYVLDEWQWKHNFVAAASMYKTGTFG